MVAAFALAYLHSARLPALLRAASSALLFAALAGLAGSYSRSAWLFGTLPLVIGAAVLFAWRDRSVLPSIVAAGALFLLAGPWLFTTMFRRLIDAPSESLVARFEQFPTALSIWRENFLFDASAGNYIGAMAHQHLDWAFEITVHNVPLYIAAELGLFAVVVYKGSSRPRCSACGALRASERNPAAGWRSRRPWRGSPT